mmetsp:Transcript_60291/g.97703  ORF Transcript_60291/g.97703 Transcript_60291/m.97703 type:complete len:208 (-) Transcript_60291:697-1320(-)
MLMCMGRANWGFVHFSICLVGQAPEMRSQRTGEQGCMSIVWFCGARPRHTSSFLYDPRASQLPAPISCAPRPNIGSTLQTTALHSPQLSDKGLPPAGLSHRRKAVPIRLFRKKWLLVVSGWACPSDPTETLPAAMDSKCTQVHSESTQEELGARGGQAKDLLHGIVDDELHGDNDGDVDKPHLEPSQQSADAILVHNAPNQRSKRTP